MASTYNQAMIAHYETFLELSPMGQRLWGALLHSPDLTTAGVIVWSQNYRKRLAAGMGTTTRALEKAAAELADVGLLSLPDRQGVAVITHLYDAASRLRGKVAHGALNEMRRLPDCEVVAELREILKATAIQLRSKPDKRSKSHRTPAPTPTPTPTKGPPISPKGKRKRFSPPTREECQQHAEAKGWGRQLGAEFFDYFTADPDRMWIDAKGQPVKSWKQKMHTWSKYHTNNKGPRQPPLSRNAAIGQAWGELAMGKDYA